MTEMQNLSQNITDKIDEYVQLLDRNRDIGMTFNPDIDSWSINQIVGHLIDSASNNHQRIIRLLISETADFPDYDKDSWLKAGNYNRKSTATLIAVFVQMNRLLAEIIRNIDKSCLNHVLRMKWGEHDSVTLAFICEHYYEHLCSHYRHLEKRIAECRKCKQNQ